MLEKEEIIQTIQRLQKVFEDLTVRGLRAVGPQQLTSLTALKEEMTRIGAAHMSSKIDAIVVAIRNDDSGSAKALMEAQASLRVFERLFTIKSVSYQLSLSTIVSNEDADDCVEEEV